METKIKCDICSKIFKTNKTLSTHKRKFHKDTDKEVEEENIKIVQEESENLDNDSDEVILKKLERLIDIQNFIKSCDENIVDVVVSTSEDKNDKTVRWICGYEKLKRDDEFDTLEDKVKYYKDLLQRNRIVIITI